MDKYSKDYYLERFRAESADELLRRYADINLHEEANEALRQLLGERAVPRETIEKCKTFNEKGETIAPQSQGDTQHTGCLVMFRLIVGMIFLVVAAFALLLSAGGLGSFAFLLVIAVGIVLAWALGPVADSSGANRKSG